MTIQTTITLIDEPQLNVSADDSVSRYALQQYLANRQPNGPQLTIHGQAFVLTALEQPQEAAQASQDSTQYVGPTPPPNDAPTPAPGTVIGIDGWKRWPPGKGGIHHHVATGDVIDLADHEAVLKFITELRQQTQEARDTAEHLGKNRDSWRVKAWKANAERDEWKAKNVELRGRIRNQVDLLQDRSQEIEGLRKRIDDLISANNCLPPRKDPVQAEYIDNLEKRIKQLEHELDEEKSRHAEWEDRAVNAERELGYAKEEIKANDHRLAEATARAERIGENRDYWRDEANRRIDDLKDVNQQNVQLKRRLRAIQKTAQCYPEHRLVKVIQEKTAGIDFSE